MSIQISHRNITLWHETITLTHPFSHLIVISVPACSQMELCTPVVFPISVTGNSILHLVQAPNFEISFDSSSLSPYTQSSKSTANGIEYILKTFPGSDYFPLFLLTPPWPKPLAHSWFTALAPQQFSLFPSMLRFQLLSIQWNDRSCLNVSWLITLFCSKYVSP